MARDGDAMSVGAEIAQCVFRAAEGPLRVDDPVMTEQCTQPGCEGARLGKRPEVAVELEHACMESVTESGDELAAEDTGERFNWKKERAG